MALIKCSECGKEFSNLANACPNCGCPTKINKNNELDKKIESNNINRNIELDKKIASNNINRNKNNPLNGCLVTLIIMFIIPAFFLVECSVESNNAKRKKENEKIEAQQKREEEELAQQLADEEKLNELKMMNYDLCDNTSDINIENYEFVNINDIIIGNTKQLNNNKVALYCSINYVVGLESDYYERSSSSVINDFYYTLANEIRINSDISSTSVTDGGNDVLDIIFVNAKYKEELEKTNYCLIVGELVEEEYSKKIENAYIITTDNIKSKEYESIDVKNEYENAQQEYWSSLKDNCASITYDELVRNPSQYKGSLVKIKVKITNKDEDGWILKGGYIGKYENKDIVLFDNRLVQEPNIMEGDTLTIYGYANGLTKIYEYVDDYYLGVVDKNTDTYEVPYISILDVKL